MCRRIKLNKSKAQTSPTIEDTAISTGAMGVTRLKKAEDSIITIISIACLRGYRH